VTTDPGLVLGERTGSVIESRGGRDDSDTEP